MTDEKEKQLRTELLLELDEKSRKLKTARGPIRDWGKRIFGLGARMDTLEELRAEDRETVAKFPEIAILITEYQELLHRVRELEQRRRDISGE